MGERYASPEKLAREVRAPLQVCQLVFAVAENDPETIRLIRSGARDEDSIRLRWAVILVARLHAGAKLEEIARALNLDHSTVKRAIDSVMAKWLEDADLRRIAGRITMEKASWQARTVPVPELPFGKVA